MSKSGLNRVEIGRLDRACTLLLAALALALIAYVGWGGPILDLGLVPGIGARLLAASRDSVPLWPATLRILTSLRTADFAPVVGTLVTVLLAWHVLSLVAEVVLVVADGLGWLGTRWLLPFWRILDALDSGPLARPKRIVIAGALATQVLVRSGVPVHAAPIEAARPVVVVQQRTASSTNGSAAGAHVARMGQDQPARPFLVQRVQRGDTLVGLALGYYGNAGHWITLYRANAGSIMGWADGGRGEPVRLTNPDFILAGWDLVVPPVAGCLEEGPNGEVIYVVQPGDTLSGIADRFGVSLDDLWAVNEGVQAPDGRVVDNPDLIWPEVRIQVQPLEPAAAPSAVEPEVSAPAPEASTAAAPAPTEVAAVPTPVAATVPVAATSTAAAQPTSTPVPTSSAPTEAATVVPESAPPVVAAARGASSELPPWWPVAPVVAAAAVAGVLVARRRRRPFETHLSFARGRVSANPTRTFEVHTGGDPAEQAAAALLRLSANHEVAGVQVVAVYRDPTEVSVVLAAPLVERDRLRLVLTAAAAPLAERVTVWATGDHDIAVRLEGPRPGALAAVEGDLPLLVSIGGLGDGRELLGGWETLGHLLLVSRSGTDDAPVQLTATLAMLAACRPAERLQLYTCAQPDSPLDRLRELPHQQVVADTSEAVHELFVALERVLDGAQGDDSNLERVLVVGELGDLADDELARLQRLLAIGPPRGLRVLAATTNPAVAGAHAASFPSRVVYALGDEEESVRVLGSADAAGLADDGSMLVRLGGRSELIEAWQLRVLDDELETLVAVMRASTRPAGAPEAPTDAAPRSDSEQGRPFSPTSTKGVEASEACDSDTATSTRATTAGDEPTVVDRRAGHGGEAEHPAPAEAPIGGQDQDAVAPAHIVRLLEHAEPDQLVLQCLGGLGVWRRDRLGRVRLVGPGTGPGQLVLNRQLDLLSYVAVRTSAGEPSGTGAAVPEIEARAELWSDAASKQTVGITARRLVSDLNKVGVQPRVPPVRVEHGRISLDDSACLVDIAAFQRAVAAARAARGVEGLAAAEAAVNAYGGPLLEGIAPDPDEDNDGAAGVLSVPGKSENASAPSSAPAARGGRPASGPLLGWSQELPALSIASRIEALQREALGLLAARLQEAARLDEALDRAWQALTVGEIVPFDDADRLSAIVMEAASAFDQPHVQAQYERLRRRLDECGLEIPPHVQRQYARLQRSGTGESDGGPSTDTRLRSAATVVAGVRGTRAVIASIKPQ